MNKKEQGRIGEAQPSSHGSLPAEPEAQSVEATLKERGKRYGKFSDHAALSQKLKCAVWDAWANRGQEDTLDKDMAEALDMILHKVARIVNGDPNYDDNWRDICGYSQLVLDRLVKEQGAPDHDMLK